MDARKMFATDKIIEEIEELLKAKKVTISKDEIQKKEVLQKGIYDILDLLF